MWKSCDWRVTSEDWVSAGRTADLLPNSGSWSCAIPRWSCGFDVCHQVCVCACVWMPPGSFSLWTLWIKKSQFCHAGKSDKGFWQHVLSYQSFRTCDAVDQSLIGTLTFHAAPTMAGNAVVRDEKMLFQRGLVFFNKEVPRKSSLYQRGNG